MESHWKLPPTLGWLATVMHPRTKWTLNHSIKILRKCTTLKSAINFLRPCKLNSQIIYSVHYNKAEILTLGESGAVVAANNTERVSTVPKPVPTPDASSVGTGRAGGSVYPSPRFRWSSRRNGQNQFPRMRPNSSSTTTTHPPTPVLSTRSGRRKVK